MAKTKTVYVCSNCGADSPKWLGKCPNCGEWNTYVEEIVTKEPAVKRPVPGIMEGNKIRPVLLRDITTEEEARIDLKDDELNRVLGGGLVKGSLVLIGGEPGIGKSTLVLQTVLGLTGLKTLYVSGEESSRQLKLRADRLSELFHPMRDASGTDFYASGQYPAGLDDHRFHTNHLYGSRGIFPRQCFPST